MTRSATAPSNLLFSTGVGTPMSSSKKKRRFATFEPSPSTKHISKEHKSRKPGISESSDMNITKSDDVQKQLFIKEEEDEDSQKPATPPVPFSIFLEFSYNFLEGFNGRF